MSKESWPEVVGMNWEEARDKIKADHPNITVQAVPENSCVTMDYRTDRVRITINGEGTVTVTPNIG